MSLALIFSTFGLIFLAELPDKTALAALLLSTRYRARDVILGAWLAFVVQTVVGVAAGSALSYLPRTPIQVASGIGFLIFAVLAIRRMGEDEKAEAADEAQAFEARKKSRPIWLVSFLVIFAAEWGDLTQLATAALVARNGHPFSIGLGAILGLWAVTLVAATAGSQLGKYVKPRLINLISGILFAAIGIFIIASALM